MTGRGYTKTVTVCTDKLTLREKKPTAASENRTCVSIAHGVLVGLSANRAVPPLSDSFSTDDRRTVSADMAKW